jgi:hypothetical protein
VASALATAAVALTLPACDSAPTWHQDVQPIVEAHCGACHGEDRTVAPFPLLTLEDAAPRRELISEAVQERRMPPWGAMRGLRPLRHDFSLEDAQIATIVDWAEGGAPAGDAAQPASPIALDLGDPLSPDFLLEMPEAFTPDVEPDTYRCFPVDWPLAETAWVSGQVGLPDQLAEVHHLIVFLVDAPRADIVRGFDAESEGPGYPCFGGATTSVGVYDGPPVQERHLGHWAPGVQGTWLPSGTGIRVEPGSVAVLQVHYNLDASSPLPDRSSVGIALSDGAPEREGWFMPWLDMRWHFQPETMTIAAGEDAAHVQYESDVSGSAMLLSSTGGDGLDGGLLVHGAFPHMHRLGADLQLTQVDPAAGLAEPLLRVPYYDFHWQRDYWFREAVHFSPQDRLRLECWFDNSEEHRSEAGSSPIQPVDVQWGEGSDDEMCLAIAYVTEP